MNIKSKVITYTTAIFIVFAMAIFSTDANAKCCKRKGDFGCCGNGKCNVFCCNCKGGCNETCQNTSCTSGEWALCAGICGTCAGVCYNTLGAACASCMGVSYEACKKCYVSGVRSVQDDKLSSSERDEFFKSIASNGKSISLADFTAFVQKEMKITGKTKTTASIEEMFKAFDVNGDGVIDRSEFDNESVEHGLVDK